MSLLARLKPQPRWKNPDPAVRIAAIAELDDAGELKAVAREDADPSVRRAAVRRLGDVAFLAVVAREDADERVREEAVAGLVEMATSGGPDEGASAVAGLSDARSLAQVAKSAAHAATRQAAIARLTDAHALGSVARQAADVQTAMQALDALADEHELVDVAINSEHRDVAAAALEKIAARTPEAHQTFKTIAARAKHKTAGRHAAALVQALEDADAARQAAAAERQKQQAALCESVESSASLTDWRAADAALARAADDWRALGADDVAPELARRFAAAVEAARAAIARRREDTIAQERRAEALARERAIRVALCERVEELTVPNEEARAALAAVQDDWSALAPAAELPAAEQRQLQARFERAVDGFNARTGQWEATEAARARLEALATEAEALAAQEDLSSVPPRWSALGAEWQGLLDTAGAAPEGALARFEQAGARLAARDVEVKRHQEQAKRDTLSRLTQLCTHLESRAGAEDLKLKEAERGLRNIRTALDAPLPLPTRKDEEQIVERLKALHAALVPRARALRELDDWKRFANAAAQEQLIAQMDALRAEADLEKAAQALRDLHERWREVAEAPRDHAEALWRRFKTASDEIRTKCGEFFAQRAEERGENLRRKEELCQKAEALAHSTDWIKTAEELKHLQAEWTTLGPVSRKHAKVVWKRFRAACDTFFTRRHEDLAQRKQMWSANLERKLALCAQAEALADSTEWESAAAELRRLQAEWKSVGAVRKNKSEIVWQRFRTACDRFFERYKHRHQIDLGSRLGEREAVVVELEALVPAEGAAPPDTLVEQAVSCWSRWNQLPTLPRELIEPLSNRLTAAIGRLVDAYPDRFRGTALDPEPARRKMESLCQKVEHALAAEPEMATAVAASPATILAERLREALAANTIAGRASSRVSEESKWRAAADEVKDAQAAWRRLGPVAGEAGRALADRFNRACQRFFDQQRRHRGPQHESDAPHRPAR